MQCYIVRFPVICIIIASHVLFVLPAFFLFIRFLDRLFHTRPSGRTLSISQKPKDLIYIYVYITLSTQLSRSSIDAGIRSEVINEPGGSSVALRNVALERLPQIWDHYVVLQSPNT